MVFFFSIFGEIVGHEAWSTSLRVDEGLIVSINL